MLFFSFLFLGWSTLVPAAPLSGVFRLAAGGGHTCALDVNLVLRCWGKNDQGQLGINHTTDRSTPTIVSGIGDDILAVAAGGSHTCLITSNLSDLYCWGANNFGQLGDGTTSNRLMPTLIGGLGDVLSVAPGVFHTCLLDINGAVQCFGRNVEGQLGDGTNSDRANATDVLNLAPVLDVYAGGFHSCAITTAGGVQCWGSNDSGQLGDGTLISSNVPVDVTNLAGIVDEISAGLIHTCALIRDGTVQCWGEFPGATPMTVSGFTDIRTLDAGAYHQCAVTNAGAALCMGWNGKGQLGDGTTLNRDMPVAVQGLNVDVTEIAAGGTHSCAAATDGELRCWGSNVNGQLAVSGGDR